MFVGVELLVKNWGDTIDLMIVVITTLSNIYVFLGLLYRFIKNINEFTLLYFVVILNKRNLGHPDSF